MITKEDKTPFTEEEIFPIKQVRFEDEAGVGAFGTVQITFLDGSYRVFKFEGIEGRLSL